MSQVRTRRTAAEKPDLTKIKGGATAPASEQKNKMRGDLHDVYHRLRQDILNGSIAPGEILNQVHIAQSYGVSRTPVREAMRLLQAEGLVEAKFQHRMRVTEVTPGEVDAIYATWIMMEALAVAMTVPNISPADLGLIREALHDMNENSPVRKGHQNEWDRCHQSFHRRLIMHADPIVVASIDNCWARSERARRVYLRSEIQSWLDSDDEHNDIVEAYAEGLIARAVHITSRQLARIALIVIGNLDPEYEPRAIRLALNLTTRPVAQEKEPAKERPGKTAAARQKWKKGGSPKAGSREEGA